MRGEWVTTKEAAKIIGCGAQSVTVIARREGWEVKLVQRTKEPFGPPYQTFRRTAAKKYAKKKADRKLRSYNKTKKTSIIVELVKWADSLIVWPTYEEIMAHTSQRFTYWGIVSILENRSEREKGDDGKPYKWVGRPRKRDEHESNICETAVGVGASH